MNSNNAKELLSKLAPQQLEVVKRVCKGYGYKEIGKELYISLSAVKAHMTAVYKKLELFDLSKDDRKFQLRLIYCPLLQEMEETLPQEQSAQELEPEMESASINSDEEKIIDGDEEKKNTRTSKPENGGQEKMDSGKGRGRLRLILVFIVAALLIFAGWQGLKWFGSIPTGLSGNTYEMGDWAKQDDVWVRLYDYEVSQNYIRLNFEIWNKTGQDIYFSWSPEQNFSMTDNKDNRYEIFTTSTREESVENNERLHFTGHGYDTIQFEDDPIYDSEVTDLYITMEYLSKIDKAIFHISVGN